MIWCHFGEGCLDCREIERYRKETGQDPIGMCPAGCGCRIWTEDADVRDCACDGPCCWTSWSEFMNNVVMYPDDYVDYRDGGLYMQEVQ